MRKALAFTIGTFLVGNLFLFLVYRVVFLWLFTESLPAADWGEGILSGLRLDGGLLGFELFGVGVITVLSIRIRLDWLARMLWLLTYLHILTCLSNVVCFDERNQQMGELLLAYITNPYQIYLAVLPFVVAHPIFMAVFAFGSFALLWGGFRWCGRLRKHNAPLFQPVSRFAWAVVLVFLPLLFTVEPVSVKKNKHASGWKLRHLHSKFYARFGNFTLNQAVSNPLYELFRVHIPAALKTATGYRMTEEQSLAVCRPLLGLQPGNTRYPLLKRIRSEASLGIENVVLIEVEGLSRDIFDHVVDGRPVMPFLRKIAEAGLSFTNTIQSYNATSGSVFAAATSFHKCCFDGMRLRFVAHERDGYYGCLSRILGGEGYAHYFAEGFCQSASDFITFMSNQGYEPRDYEYFERQLEAKGRLEEGNSALGVFDGYLFQECAEILKACPKKFTLHIMTATSHSPWAVPRSFRQRFEAPMFNAFAYVDESLELLFEKLKKELPAFDRTLFVIVADHTSIKTNPNLMNHIRIPLIFYSTRLAEQAARWKPLQSHFASHVDIVPTVLALMDGEHDYSGMGRNLLVAPAIPPGVLSGDNYKGYYLKGGFCLHYAHTERETTLLPIVGDQISPTDVSAQHPGIFAQMQQEYWAQYELAKRLGSEKRAYPPKKDEPAK